MEEKKKKELSKNLHKLIKIHPRICHSHDAMPMSFYSPFDISATETQWQLLQAPKKRLELQLQ